MKLIDAEKLKAEIERRRLQNRYIDTDGYEQELFEIIDSLQQEQPSEICSKCIHHGKDDGYCYNPHGGMRSLINENGVYECTGFCEQEQPEVDLDADIEMEWDSFNKHMAEYGVESEEVVWLNWHSFNDVARHFAEWGAEHAKK